MDKKIFYKIFDKYSAIFIALAFLIVFFLFNKQANIIDISSTDTMQNVNFKEILSVNKFRLKDYLTDNSQLSRTVDIIFNKLTDEERISQMIVTSAGKNGKSYDEVLKLAKEKKIGGIIFMGGSTSYIKSFIDKLDTFTTVNKNIPLIYSIDAEPGIINSRIHNIRQYPSANSIHNSAESRIIAKDISMLLKILGVNHNFAPVCDYGLNKDIIGNRSFGVKQDSLFSAIKAFIDETQSQNLIATAKHYPGHGNVYGDSHKELVYIDGDLKEINIFKEAIDSGVLSVMVGHIAVKNNDKYNTDGKPASISEKLINGLLKKELNFKGIVITDAMNMKAVSSLKSPALNAAKAGCDMILMPSDESKLQYSIKTEMNNNPDFKKQVYESVKKIIRIKICLGLFDKYIESFVS